MASSQTGESGHYSWSETQKTPDILWPGRRVLSWAGLDHTRDSLMIWSVYLVICIFITVFMIRFASKKVRTGMLFLTIFCWCMSLVAVPLLMSDMYKTKLQDPFEDKRKDDRTPRPEVPNWISYNSLFWVWSLYFLIALVLRW